MQCPFGLLLSRNLTSTRKRALVARSENGWTSGTLGTKKKASAPASPRKTKTKQSLAVSAPAPPEKVPQVPHVYRFCMPSTFLINASLAKHFMKYHVGSS